MCCSLPLLLRGFVKVNEVGDGNDDSQKVPSVTYTDSTPGEWVSSPTPTIRTDFYDLIKSGKFIYIYPMETFISIIRKENYQGVRAH